MSSRSTAWIAAVLLAAWPLQAQAQEKSSSPDASLTAQVQKVLARDPFLRAMDIKVETQSGVVSLTGSVRSVEDIGKAGELARGVSGVSAVRNGLRVQNRPSRA